MLAARLDLVIDAGTTVTRSFALTDGTPTAFNLTGYRAMIAVRSAWLPSGTLYEVFGTTSPYAGITIPTPSNGIIVWGPNDRTTLDNIPVDTVCYWDLFIYVPSGVEYRMLYGTFLMRGIASEVP